MSDTSKLSTCQMVCWGLAGLTGLMVALASARSLAVIPSLLLGIALAVVVGVVLRWLVCTDYPADDRGIGTRDVMRGVRNLTGITGYKAPLDQAGAMEVAMGKAPKTARAEPKPAEAEKPAEVEKSAASAGATSAVKSGTTLAGETELADRKGTWRYDAGNEAGTDAEPGQTTTTVDASIGVKPAGLSAPRGGQPDDLKQIKGVGPKLEQACHNLGYYHFDQIAAWTPDEVAWVDENLVGFKGRVSRDNWVEQAKTLAAGGETEFSRRVAKDDAH
ncbi:MAG: NADH:ubiquinone oxidoreductase [Roseovarius sp.]